MATPAQIRNAVDTRLANLWSTIQTRQDAYHATHGRYWQGRRTHTLDPADGTEVLPDIGTACPPDSEPYPASWRSQTYPMSLQLDVYDGPQGKGYLALVQVTINGPAWRRIAQVGPETQRVRPWHQLTPLTVP